VLTSTLCSARTDNVHELADVRSSMKVIGYFRTYGIIGLKSKLKSKNR